MAAPSPDGRPLAVVQPAPYPAHREADVVLRDGSTVHVRPVRPEDEGRLLEFFRSLSEDSLTLRFFSPSVNLPGEAQREAHVDYAHVFGLIALAGPQERVVGHALYAVTTPGGEHAEVAFAVADDYQGRGLGTLLLGHLAEVASAHGIITFEAEVLPRNQRMLRVFHASGFPVKLRPGFDQVHVTFPTSLSEAALQQFEEREQIAARNSLTTFFAPRSVAVVGASRKRGTVGGQAFHNLLSLEFAGPVFPVNPTADVVQSVPAYPNVEAIPREVDLAVIAVPAAHVLEVAEQCGRKGVRALLVLSAGFAECGEGGSSLQTELVRICRRYGMRLIGPNCIGIFNTDPAVRLNATFGPFPPPAGRLAFASQSGALGLAAIDHAGARGLGISSFASMGNKADISGNDLLNYWEADPRTDVILLYLESFGNPRKFSRIARRVGRKKPIVALKSGRSSAGARATSSHTGALLAASDLTVDALFRQSGVIRTDTLDQMFDVAALLAHQPRPRGRRVGIVTNVGGPAILCADACEAEGLEVPVLADETRIRLRDFLPAEAGLNNPVDMIASATAEQYRRAIGVVADDPNVDALITIFIPPLNTRAEDVARAILDAARELNAAKPLLAVFMSSLGVPEPLRHADASARVPSYGFPESAATALAHAVRYGEWCQAPLAAPPQLNDLRRDEAMALVSAALGRGGGWLAPDDVAALLRCYRLPLVEQRTAASPREAAAAAEELGGELALKAIAAELLHKTEAGGVRLHLRGAADVGAAAEEMAQSLATAGLSQPVQFLVQRMAEPGTEMLVGIAHDPQFGPVVACGAGGVMVELLKDVSVRLTPLTRDDAAEMLRDLKTYPLLQGFRGRPLANVAALEEVLLRVSALAEDIPEVAELDGNPVIVGEHGATIVDARIRVAPAEPRRPLGARR